MIFQWLKISDATNHKPLMRTSIFRGKERFINTIIYYYLFKEKNQQFIECLKSMNVDVRECQIKNEDWNTNYIEVAKDIKNCLVEG